MTDDYVWKRMDGERPLAYEAFRRYLYLGKDRSLQGAADAVDRSYSLVRRWSSAYSWIERSQAFDSHLVTADTDDMVHDLSESRDKNLALMNKLRGLLNDRLDYFIVKRMDPTSQWTRAVEAMARVEANSLVLGKDDKQSETVGRIEALVEKAIQLQNRMPEGL